MKILFISPSFFPSIHYGGPIYSTYELAKALKKANIDIRVITTNANGNDKLNIKSGVFHKLENELPVKYFNSFDSRGTSLSMILNLRKEIKKSDIVYLVSIFSPPTPFTVFLCRLYKKPLIISPRGQLGKWCLEQGSIFKKLWLRLFIHPVTVKSKTKPDHLVTAKSTRLGEASRSRKTKPEQLVSAKPDLSGEDGPAKFSIQWHLASTEEEQDVLTVYPSAETFVIPNIVSSELLSLNSKLKDRSFYNKYSGFDCTNKKIIISMGRLHSVKGFDILISAMSITQRKDAVLFIAGENFGDRKNLEMIIDKFNLRDKVFLVGNIDRSDKIEFLKNADLFALASHHENFGIVYAEALASGLPIIASKNTPWQEVEKYNCGLWVENTPESFAKAITEILSGDLVQMGENGMKYIEENFGSDVIIEKYKKMFESILNGR